MTASFWEGRRRVTLNQTTHVVYITLLYLAVLLTVTAPVFFYDHRAAAEVSIQTRSVK